MTYLIIWCLVAEILGIVALPFTFRLFKNLPDKGYAFSKAIGILLPLYFIWMAVSLRILPNSLITILIIIGLLTVGAFFVFRKDKTELLKYIRNNGRLIFTIESLFLVSFILLAIFRSYIPDIYGTERPMDFAFINSLLRAQTFPPPDPWLSGYTLNNYYLGHLIIAIFTRITATPPGVSFNIALCLFFALASIGIFSLVFNLIRTYGNASKNTALKFSFLGLVLFLFIGNLEGILELLYARGIGGAGFWQWIGIKELTYPPAGDSWLPNTSFWWWKSTRIIDTVVGGNSLDYTITEYPAFSFILGDLHAHVMSLPFTLLAIAMSLNIFLTKEKIEWKWLKTNILSVLIMLICLGSLGAIHSWDFPTYTLLFLGALLLQIYATHQSTETQKFKQWIKLSAIIVIALFVLYLPFYLNMKNPVMGILPWQGPVTRPFYYLLIFGLFLFAIISFLVVFTKNEKLKWSKNNVIGAILVTALPLILWSALTFAIGIVNVDVSSSALAIIKMSGHLLPIFLLAAFVLFCIFNRVKNPYKDNNILFVLLLLFLAVWITIACEMFYIGDVFNNRMNTIFRFYYQSWTLFAIVAAFAVYYLCYHHKFSILPGIPKRIANPLWKAAFAILLAISLILPSGAVYDRVANSSTKPTLDGLSFIHTSNPSEWESINWLNTNVKGSPVIVEATGGEYTQYGRISVNTGLPTILGWAGHELVWRGPGKELDKRSRDIDTIYRSNSIIEVQNLLTQYNVTYIYFGYLETERYGTTHEDVFNAFMDIAYQNSDVTIYQIRTANSPG